MLPTDPKATPEFAQQLLERFKVACDLKMAPDLPRITASMQRWAAGFTKAPVRVGFIANATGVRETARAARAARAARDAWDAWDARAARDAWAARAARDAWAAWAARAARAARAAYSYSWDASWAAIPAIGAADRGLQDELERWLPTFEAFEAGAFAFWFTADDEVRVATVPQRVRVDSARRLHAEDGPAFAWLEDIRDFYWHGVHVPEHVVMAPAHITYAEIAAEKNAEVRRVLIERYGEDRYIADSGMKPVAKDERFGDLYIETFESGRPIARLHVTNRSAEPDGTFRKYWLPVNPAHYGGDAGRIPQAASASTWRTKPAGKELFFRDWREYSPVLET